VTETDDSGSDVVLEHVVEPREGLRVGLPWERIEPGMTFAGVVATTRLLLFTPSAAFAVMRRQGNIVPPLVYVVALGTLGTFFGLIWQSWARAMLGSVAGGNLQSVALANSYSVTSIVLAPLFILLAAVVATAVHHVCLLLFGGAPRPPEVTLRVVCYAWGAAYVWMFIPACGGLIATVWGAAMTITGLREAHGVPSGRATAAVVVPYLVAGCCAVLMWTFLATTMIGSLQ
jgi:hypothetical protein